MKRAWGIAAVILLLVTLFSEEVVRAQYRKPIWMLIYESDTQVEAQEKVWAWYARRVLSTLRPTKDDIGQLNQDAGARFIATLQDQSHARALLIRFKQQGLDLEALDLAHQWTALQIVAMQGQLPGVELLLANGAQVKRTSADGRPLLDQVNQLAKAEPGRDYPEIIKVLQL